MKILDNLVRAGVPAPFFEESFLALTRQDSLHTDLMTKSTCKTIFDSQFIQFLFNLLIEARSCQWNDTKFRSHGDYNLSCQIIRTLRFILNHGTQEGWKESVESALDAMVSNIEEYEGEEFKALASILDGAEYLGLS